MSNFGKLNLFDLGKGLIVAVIGAVLTAVLAIVQSGTLPTLADLQKIGIVALTVGISYLLKNLFTNGDGQPLKKDAPTE